MKAFIMLAEIDMHGLLFSFGGLLVFMFWIWMLADCVKHETSDKIGWILVMVLFNILGAPVYFLVRKLPRRRARRLQPASPLHQPWKKDPRIG